MTYREIAAEFKLLPIDERLLLLEELMRSLRIDVAATMKQQKGRAPRLWRGMLKPSGPLPTDQELKEAYQDYLVEKYLIARKLKGVQEARKIVEGILAECQVALIDSGVLQDALALSLIDFEDAVQHASATGGQLDALVTRDPKDYAKATLPVLSPQALLLQLPASRDDGEPS